MAMMEKKSKPHSEPGEYDVYLSFRGPDTGRGFTAHLYSALVQSEVNVFMEDEEVRRLEDTNDTIKKAVENSRIAIVVFSEDYASSRWCLDEVDYIMEYRKSKGLIVVPVFYHVRPIHVRHQVGTYERAIALHENRYPPRKLQRWRDALRDASQLKGLISGERTDSLLVKEIVSDVLSKLKMPLLDPANLVGRYDLYLSFRAFDSCRGFIGHLYSALVQSEVSLLMDEDLPLGSHYDDTFKKAAENSRIAVVVFSQEYAHSTWCLNDVANVMECHKSNGLMVLPVFYGVHPSDVKNQRGKYEEAFLFHGKKYNPYEMERWKIALTEASSLNGFALGEGNEAQLVQEIVRAVLSKLEHSMDDMQFHVPANLVGMDSHLKAVYKLLDMDRDEVSMVALCGMGGLGKTTIAKTIFNDIGRYFRYKGFSANVRETCEDSMTRRLLKLQEGLLSQMGTKVEIWDVDEGSNKIKQRCCSSRILLVIDDFNRREQLEKLAGSCHWFGRGSKIIITTRNKSFLNDRKEIRLYEVPLLGRPDAYQLFKRTLFLENEEINAYKELIPEILDYTRGLPLAIKVVAANLRGKSKSEWVSTLKALKKIPDAEIVDILQLSYVDLNDIEKDALLHIACFFKGQPFNYVRNILECCGLLPDSVIGVLMSRYLITLKYDKIDMHDMIQEMGREIVRRQSPKDPGRRSRLWSQESILEVLTEDTGTEEIESIKLEFVAPTVVKFSANALRRMRRLKLFIAYNVHPSPNSITFPKQLRWLEWPRCPFPSPPLHKHDNWHLAGLYLSNSCIKPSEDDFKSFTNLKFINFSYSSSLRKIPDLSTLYHLESLDVEECEELVEVHQSLGSLEKLVHLNFLNCKKLRTFPITLNSEVLQDLLLKGCLKQSKFPEILVEMKNLTELTLDDTAIDELPSSIKNLIGLEEFYLENCRKLKTLPSSIYKLRKLQRVSFADCSELGEFPKYGDGSSGFLPALIYLDFQRCGLQEIDFLKHLGCKLSLEKLELSGSRIGTIPKCIEEFIALQQLNLENCKQLHDIQGLPPNINHLIAKGCESLEWHVPLSKMLKSQLEESPRIRHIDFSGCRKLTQNLSTSANFLSIEDLLADYQIKILYPGSEIPEWFDHQKEKGSLSFPVSTKLHQNIAGLAFCVVIGSGGRKIAALSCEIHVYNNNQMAYQFVDTFHSLEMDHMWLVYVPCTMMWGWKTKIQDRCSDIKVLFKLSMGKLKCCGVHLLLKEGGRREGPNFWMRQRYNENYLLPLHMRMG